MYRIIGVFEKMNCQKKCKQIKKSKKYQHFKKMDILDNFSKVMV